MVSVIRDTESDGQLPPPKKGSLWKLFLLLLVLTGPLLGWFYAQSYGNMAWVLFGLVSLMGLGLYLTQLMNPPETGAFRIAVPVSHVLERVFARSSYAGLIVESGKPVRANDSYIELVSEFGLEFRDGVPPLPEKMFKDSSEASQSALYRLSHLGDEDAFGEEVLQVRGPDGKLREFLVRVTLFKDQQYWELADISPETDDKVGFLANVPIGLISVAQDGKILTANNSFKDWVGVQDPNLYNLSEFIENPDGLLDSPKEAGRLIRFDTRLITQKDVATPVVMMAKWEKMPSGEIVAAVGLHGHSTVATESGAFALPAGDEMSITDASSDIPFATVDLNSPNLNQATIESANAAFLAMVGADDISGRKVLDVLVSNAPGVQLHDMSVDDLGGGKSVDAVIKGHDNVAVSVYAGPVSKTGHCKLFLVDISARKVLEDQLVQSQKMQAIGRLVAEIAHDFNNLLAAIRLYTDTLLGRHPIGDPSYPELQQINANVNRAAALVKKLLAYSRKQTIRAEILGASETLSDMAVTLKQVLGEKVRLEMKYGRDLPPVRADKSQFDTVLMNLAVNARDAMKEQGGGVITITSSVIQKDSLPGAGLKAALDQLKGDRVVSIAVSDTGTGMTDEIKSKIFEPFFTTKGQGEGTGLGLSTVYGIVQQSGGHLTVDSELGVGTTFTVYLPEADKEAIAEGEAAVPAIPTPPKPKAPSDLAGHGNILFVEDEDSVRVIAAKTLRKRGYTVIEAADGEEAYEIIEEAETPFDLMISDVVMPGMDGPTLLKKARPMLKETRIVFISGYAEEEFSDLLAEEPDVTFLPKPFTLIQLAEKVKQQIGEVV